VLQLTSLDTVHEMKDSPSEQRSPDESPSQGIAQNVDEAQTIAQQAETAIEASEDGETDDGYEIDSARAASTSLSSSVRDYA